MFVDPDERIDDVMASTLMTSQKEYWLCHDKNVDAANTKHINDVTEYTLIM